MNTEYIIYIVCLSVCLFVRSFVDSVLICQLLFVCLNADASVILLLFDCKRFSLKICAKFRLPAFIVVTFKYSLNDFNCSFLMVIYTVY